MLGVFSTVTLGHTDIACNGYLVLLRSTRRCPRRAKHLCRKRSLRERLVCPYFARVPDSGRPFARYGAGGGAGARALVRVVPMQFAARKMIPVCRPTFENRFDQLSASPETSRPDYSRRPDRGRFDPAVAAQIFVASSLACCRLGYSHCSGRRAKAEATWRAEVLRLQFVPWRTRISSA